MWDYIAWKVYKDEKQMEVLLKAEENAHLLEVYIFSVGEKVWCPVVAGVDATTDLPPWRTGK